MGLSVVGLGLFGVSLSWIIFKDTVNAANIITGFSKLKQNFKDKNIAIIKMTAICIKEEVLRDYIIRIRFM